MKLQHSMSNSSAMSMSNQAGGELNHGLASDKSLVLQTDGVARAVVSKRAPWQGLEIENCGWWIDISEEQLTECLREAMSKSSEELSKIGARGREWMKRDFSWKRIGKMTLETYRWILGGDDAPDWMRMD